MIPIERLIVISPHLDDGVFSCGMLLAASTTAIVVTVFAGLPDATLVAPDWDRRAGFTTAAAAMRERRREDQRALVRLNARPLWLDLLDSQYQTPVSTNEIRTRLAPILQEFPATTIAAPLGLFHSDHALVQQAALSLWRQRRGPQAWLFYEDALYRRLPGLVQQKLAAWRGEMISATPIDVYLPEFAAAKTAAVSAYASQLALFKPDTLDDLRAPERYWQLECDQTH